MSYQLESLEQMNNYYRWILDEFSSYLGGRIMEIGAGNGTVSSMLLTTSGIEHLWLVEPDGELAAQLTARFAGNAAVTVLEMAAEELTTEFLARLQLDTIVMVNVLEHIEDDEALLNLCAGALVPAGRLLTFSPAFFLLYSDYDRLAGHYRRYTTGELREKFTRANFTVARLKYFNFIGYFAWLIQVRLLKSRNFGDKRLRLLDTLLGKAKLVEQRFPPPFGQSVIAIGVKPE